MQNAPKFGAGAARRLSGMAPQHTARAALAVSLMGLVSVQRSDQFQTPLAAGFLKMRLTDLNRDSLIQVICKCAYVFVIKANNLSRKIKY